MAANSPSPRYKRPPIAERVASIWVPMTPEIYEGRFEDWRQLVEQEFTVYQPVNEWRIAVKQKDGIPLYDTMQPELRITPRFSKKHSKEGFDWSIRCPCGQFTMNMHSHPGDERGYANLMATFSRWLPRWLTHFSVTQTDRVMMHYVNQLDANTIPKFIGRDGGIGLDRILNVFAQIPGAQKAIIPPYDCKATVLLLGRDNASLHLQVLGGVGPLPSVRVDFVVEAKTLPDEREPQQLISLLNWCHDRIIERFELVFTTDAKKSFEPTHIA